MAATSRRTAITAAKREVFLAALAAGNTVTAAASAAGASREGFRLTRKRDQVFAEAWDDAYEQGTDLLEDEAWRRAVEGWEEPVVSAGQLVTTVRKYSDTLLIFLLKGRRPAKYARFEVTGAGGGPIAVRTDDSPERLAALLELAGRVGLLEQGADVLGLPVIDAPPSEIALSAGHLEGDE
jgi:hypothetical protein